VIFAYHGYPWLIHRLTYRRQNYDNIHVRGYKEEGTTTTPFDMTTDATRQEGAARSYRA
jgi:xylulose-5-phosphate/fructose-6-phosphate phosphoketolase